MNVRHQLTGILCALVVLGPGAAAPASAQDPNEPKPAMKFGPVELWPTMAFRNIGVDNNVFNEAENPKQDFTATIAPTMEVVFKPGTRVRLSYSTLTEFVWYQKYKSERSTNRGFVARGEVNLTYFTPFASYSSSQTRERPNSEIDERALRNPRVYAAGFRTKIGLATELTAAIRRNSQEYDPEASFRGVRLAQQLNNETDAIDVSLGVAVTPLTSIGLGVSKEEDRFQLSPLRDSKSLRITPTVNFKPTALLNGSASVGYMRFDAADPRVEDYAGLVARGTIAMTVERYSIDTTFGRDVRYSYEENAPTYIWTSARATLRTELFGGLDVKLGAGRDVMNYNRRADVTDEDVVPDRDIYRVYSAGLGFTLRRIRFGVDAEFNQRTSGLEDRGYENNRVFGTISWGAIPR